MNSNDPAPIAGLRGMEHVGLTVPDLDQAIDFFVSVLGADVLYEHGPFRADDNWMAVNLGVDAGAVIPRLVMVRVAHGPTVELSEYGHSDAPEERNAPPPSEVGASRLAFYVEDIDAGVETLRLHGVIVLGEPKRVVEGPTSGLAWVHFLAPWGQSFGLVSHPNGVAAYRGVEPAVWTPGSGVEEPSDSPDVATPPEPGDVVDPDPA